MNNKIKIVSEYVLAFITSIFISVLFLTLTFKKYIFNINEFERILDKNNYYEEIYNTTLEDIKDYMVSSGLEEEILDGIITQEEVKKDVINFIDSLYYNKDYKIDENRIKERLDKNIDKYLISNNIDVQDRTELELFKNDLVDIYKDRVTVYKILNYVKSPFSKVFKLINKIFIALLIVTIIFNFIIIYTKNKHIAATYMSSGLILLFIRFAIYNKLDIEYLSVLTDSFTKVVKTILYKIGNSMIIYGSILLFIGVAISTYYYFKEKKEEQLKKKKMINKKYKNRKKKK